MQLKSIESSFSTAGNHCTVTLKLAAIPFQLLEHKTFEDEEKLFQLFCNSGVYMTPGQYQACDQPGWMRLVFSGPTDALEEGKQVFFLCVGLFRNTISKLSLHYHRHFF